MQNAQRYEYHGYGSGKKVRAWKKRKHKRVRMIFASPDEAEAWIRATKRRFLSPAKTNENESDAIGEAKDREALVAPKERLPDYSPPKYSSLAKKSLVHRLSLLEQCRPRKTPYELPENVIVDGSIGLRAYTDKIVAHLRAHKTISQREHNYIHLLADILDRETTDLGPLLREAAAFRHVGHRDSSTARRTLNKSSGLALAGSKRLPWQVLPAGKWGFSQIRSHFLRLRKNRKDLKWDLQRLNFAKKLNPMESWIGQDEFDGYVVFMFRWTRAVLLDHPLKGNACYILRRNWKELSHLSKSELLQRHARTALRVIHTGNWEKRVKSALKRDKN